MTATVAVPRSVVEHARRYHRQRGQSYLYGGLAGDCRIEARAGSRGCYWLALDKARAQEIGLLELADEGDEALLLADAVVAALGCEPVRFVCEGRLVGRVSIVKRAGARAFRVRDAASLTLLSWALRQGAAGYSLTLAPQAGETTCRQLQRGKGGPNDE